jgi:predicted transcriptional regulator
MSTELPDLFEIKLMREKLGWTQKKLAQACRLSQSYINKIERNEADPGYRKARQIFHVLTDALLGMEKEAKATAKDIMTRHVEHVSSNQFVDEVRRIMVKNDYSQLPVVDNGIVKGSITDRLLVSLVNHHEPGRKQKVSEVMGRKFPVVDPDTKLETLRHLLDEYPAILVNKGNRDYGIVTKHDILRTMR